MKINSFQIKSDQYHKAPFESENKEKQLFSHQHGSNVIMLKHNPLIIIKSSSSEQIPCHSGNEVEVIKRMKGIHALLCNMLFKGRYNFLFWHPLHFNPKILQIKLVCMVIQYKYHVAFATFSTFSN